MKKILFITLTLLALVAGKWYIQAGSTPCLTIAILQTAAHPALDMAACAFKEQLQSSYKGEIRWIESQGMGQTSTLAAMAQSFHRDSRINLVFTIGTAATQVMAIAERNKPIVFAAVTDPSILHLGSQDNVCGCSDAIDASNQITVIRTLMPQVKNIALLFNPAESNSQSAVKKLQLALQEMSIGYTMAPIQSATDIPSVVTRACESSDLLLAPADNLVATTMPLIAKIAASHQKNVIASDTLLCGPGLASAAFGIDYGRCGAGAAHLAQMLIQDPSLHASSLATTYIEPTLIMEPQRAALFQTSHSDN